MSPGLDPRQVRDFVVRPALQALGLPGGEVAERLVVGTAAQESGFRFLHQVGGGPALSLWQIEPATVRDAIARAPKAVAAGLIDPEAVLMRLPGDLYLGAALCRLVYYLKSFTMPINASVEDLARIWKQYYNTPQGAGTVEQFVANWERCGMSSLYAR